MDKWWRKFITLTGSIDSSQYGLAIMEPASCRHGSGKCLLDGFKHGSFEVCVDEDGFEFGKKVGESIKHLLVQPVWFACHQDVEYRQNHPFVRNQDVENLSERSRGCFEGSICKNVRAVVIQNRQQDGAGEN